MKKILSLFGLFALVIANTSFGNVSRQCVEGPCVADQANENHQRDIAAIRNAAAKNAPKSIATRSIQGVGQLRPVEHSPEGLLCDSQDKKLGDVQFAEATETHNSVIAR
jgi:hypothetical protein